MAEEAGEKNIKATPKRRQDAKREGDLPRSKEFPNLFTFIFALIFLSIFGATGVQLIGVIFKDYLRDISDVQVNQYSANVIISELVRDIGTVIIPFFGVILIVGIVASIAFQGGWNWTLKPFQFRADKFSPTKGLKRLFFSKQAIANFARAIIIVAAITLIAWQSLNEVFPKLYGLQMLQLDLALKFTFDFIFFSLYKLAFLFLILAFLDLAWTKYSHEKKLKMTNQQYKDELKNTEGDPKIKRKIRTVQFQMHRKRMMAAVPEADVVVTNPVHLAVALKYDTETAPAPEVLAKGQGYLADKIKTIASENDIPIVENQGLAQALFKSCEVGDVVPPDLYKAVAEILAYVYKLKGKIPA